MSFLLITFVFKKAKGKKTRAANKKIEADRLSKLTPKQRNDERIAEAKAKEGLKLKTLWCHLYSQ